MRRTMLAAVVGISLLTGLTGFPTGASVAPVLAQDVLVIEGMLLPRRYELQDAKVTFDDNSIFDPESRSRILREDSSVVFDLRGQRRVIKSMAFQYRSLDRREGKATVLVYGEH